MAHVEAEILYEPRAFWHVESLTPLSTVRGATVVLPRANFTNGERHPIHLDHALIAPVGYLLQDFAGTVAPPVAAIDFRNCASALEYVRMMVTSPGRQHFMLRPSGQMPILPRCDVGMEQSPAFPYSSGLHGVCRWDFTKGMKMPRFGTCEFLLGPFVGSAAVGTIEEVDLPRAEIAFFEPGKTGLYPGNARTSEPFNLLEAASPAVAGMPVDAFGFNADPATMAFPPGSRFPPREYKKQSQTNSGSDVVSGFAVMIDQVLFDDFVQTSAVANVAGSPVASLAHRIATRARCVDGNSQMDWWRPGAPLSLVCPSMGPASIFQFRKPITLHPGDVLEVELEVPPGVVVEGEDLIPTYNVGVSFTVYAAIEG